MTIDSTVIHYTQASRSGAAFYVFNLVRAVAQTGINIHFVCPNDYEYIDSLSNNGQVKVYSNLPRLIGVQGVWRKLWQMKNQSITGVRTVWKLRKKSMIVHVNFPGLSFFAVPLLIGFRLSRIKLIVNVHDVIPHKWLLPRFFRFFERAMLWGMYRIANKLVVHHDQALNLLIKKFKISSDKVKIIPHGSFQLSETPPIYNEEGEFVALLFGSLRENKGIHLAIQAVQEMRCEGYPIRLIIAGDAHASEKGYWERCKNLIEGSPSGIEVFDRYIEDDEIQNFIGNSHFFLLPYTEFYSQSGVAVLALSNKRSIVATGSGGLSEILLPEQTGIPIKEPTTEAVKEALVRTVRMGHYGLKHMGEEAFTFFKENYSWDSIVGKYIELYQDLGFSDQMVKKSLSL